jgi:oxygen-independent coproporphyrinogen III oxidase
VPGVYISYPFCNQKCTFCNFASGVSGPETIARYHQTLLVEVLEHVWAWKPETVYFGGGTPSLAPGNFLRAIMEAIPSERLTEVTLECAPGTVTPEAIELWRECGINRLSLGVQSFVAKELRQTGRRHDRETVEREIELLRRGDIANINIDLIAGLPEQTLESMGESLEWIERLAAPHVSLYIFEVDEDSRLGNEILLGGKRYGAPRVPSDELTAQLYEKASEALRRLGYHHYEISNYARAGFESRHNLKYWLLEPYIGFGLDAHSFDGKQRWGNADNFEGYLSGKAPAATISDTSEEHFFVGLRLLDGIEPTAVEWQRFAEPIRKWQRAGMLETMGPRLRLTREAVLISNEIFQEFLNV